MDVFLDGLFALLANAWPPVRRAGRRWRDPYAWADADPSMWSWLAGGGLLLPVVPVAVGAVHVAAFAWRIADDDLLFVLGLFLFLPVAVFAIVAACLLASWALTLAFWVVTGRQHAMLIAGGYLFLTALLSWPLFSAGLAPYAWALAGTTASAALLLAARATASRSG